MEMLCEHQYLPPTTDNSVPSRNECKGLAGGGAAPSGAAGRGPGHTIPGAHHVLVPLSLPQPRGGAELCAAFGPSFICAPPVSSLDSPSHSSPLTIKGVSAQMKF